MALMPADPPALVLLDLGLPGEDGFSIARQLREHWRCGLVIVTGRGDAVDKVVGLEVGADDYVTKPFDLRELLARIKAVLRRVVAPEPAVSTAAAAARGKLVFAGWALDTAARRLTGDQGRRGTADERRVRPAVRVRAAPGPRAVARLPARADARPRGRRPSTARSTCRSGGCARSSKPTRKIRRSSSRCAARATSSCRR